MPTHDYWLRPTNLAFHDLTTRLSPPRNLRSLLGLGLKFIPNPLYTTRFNQLQAPGNGLAHLERSLRLACFFLAHPPPPSDYNPSMHLPSSWIPPDKFFPGILRDRLLNFAIALRTAFRPRRAIPNLALHHRHALEYLRTQKEFFVVHCDKNLGPAIIEREEYIRLAFRDHLSDRSTYHYLSSEETQEAILENETNLCLWLAQYKDVLLPSHFKYLVGYKATVTDPLPYFYLLMKIHKTPLKTRPIVSYSGSLFYGLGKWVDYYLQQVSRTFRSFLKSSFHLKHELDSLSLPPNCFLFTADATAMYTNIDSTAAINGIHRYIISNLSQFSDIPVDALISALKLIMNHNVFQFGDTAWLQLSGTAMGAPPAPPYATASFGTHEETILDDFADNLLLYRRYIDDVFGIWICHPDPATNDQLWTQFRRYLNLWHGLEWTVSPLSLSVQFLDLVISIVDGSVVCSLYQKPMNLHLYIPPRSAHPPGVLFGLIAGWIYRSFSLCTKRSDSNRNIRSLWKFLVARGYQPTLLRPLFKKALANVRPFDPSFSRTATDPDQDRFWLFKLDYHPQDPPSSTIQRLWQSTVAAPSLRKPLSKVDVHFQPIGERRFIVCYKRAPNLNNLLSYRKL